MEYLDISNSLDARHIQVPLYATQKLSKDTVFTNFSHQYFTELDDGHDTAATQLTPADFLQSWLYFGLLSKLTGEELSPQEFGSTDEQGTSYVGLGRLVAVLQKLDKDGTAAPFFTEDFLASLRTCEKIMRKYEELLVERPPSDVDLVLLSINILLAWLHRGVRPRPHSGAQSVTPSTRALRQIAQANKWCIHHWSRICREFDYVQSYFLLTIPRRTPDSIKHNNCTEQVCRAWSIALTPDVVHAEVNCECSIQSFSTKKVCKIIRKGGIPMISSRVNKKGKVIFKLEPWNSWTPYIAISHVWADGLGNIMENALPQCQLLRIHKLLSKVPLDLRCRATDKFERLLARRKHLFWLDTLCIPVHGSQASESDTWRMEVEAMKKAAIDSMGFIYAGATVVLALDGELRSLPDDIDRISLMSLIVHCGWTTRGWTLQEGSLPKNLLFPWAQNQIFSPDSRLDVGNSHSALTSLLEGNQTSVALLQRLSQVWSYHALRSVYHDDDVAESAVSEPEDMDDLSIQHSASSRLLATWNNLAARHTSQPHDLPVILANILRYQASEVSHQKKPLGALLYTLPALPLSVIFIGCGRRTFRPADQSYPAFDETIVPHISSGDNDRDQTDRALRDVVEISVNRWIPEEIDGVLTPHGMLSFDKEHLTYTSPQQGGLTRFHLIKHQTTLPDIFLVRYGTERELSFLVELVYSEADIHVLKKLEQDASGFYIVLEKPISASPFGREPVRSAIFAVLKEDESTIGYGNPRAYFFCHARSKRKEATSNSDTAEGLLGIYAPQERPRQLRIVYDQKQFVKLENDQFKTNAEQYRIVDVFFLRVVLFGPAVLNAIFTALIFYNYREDHIPALATVIGVYWIAIGLLPFIPNLFISWHQRLSLSGRFQNATISPARRRFKQLIYSISTALILNVGVQVFTYHGLHYIFLIALITAGGRVGAMFAFTEGFLLPLTWAVLFSNYLNVLL